MKKIVLALVMFGCGDGLPDKDFGRECREYDQTYSHSVLFCGGRDADNVEDVFLVCNPRRPHCDSRPDCIAPDLDLMRIEDGCEVQHVCWRD